jgi:hypothetical protein
MWLCPPYIRLACTCVWNLTVPMYLGFLLTGPFCPMSNHGNPVTLLKFQMTPRLMLLISSGSKKRSPDTHVSVRRNPHIHKECGPMFPLSLHTSYIMDCPAALVGEDVSSGCTPSIHKHTLNRAQITPSKLKSTLIEHVFTFLSMSYFRYTSLLRHPF